MSGTNNFYDYSDVCSDLILSEQIPMIFEAYDRHDHEKDLRVLSLFSGCGGMDIGFEGGFITNRKSVGYRTEFIKEYISPEWVMLDKTRFKTVFANDILPEAEAAWVTYMSRYGTSPDVYHRVSIVDLVKMHKSGVKVFPENVDIVTGGFPCQDFSVAGKRKGFDSEKDDMGKKRSSHAPTEENRGKLYFWMKQVIDITKPKIFIAENVKGLVNLGDVKRIIQEDFASAGGDGYIVLDPQVLHAGDFGVPESRERVIFIGIRKDALNLKALNALLSDVVQPEYYPYPVPTHACTIHDDRLYPIVTTYDVLKNLQEPEFSKDPSQQIYSKAKFLNNGSQGQIEIKLGSLGPTIRSEHHGNIEFRRLSSEHGGKHFDELDKGLQERRLTPRECAMIQTFPPDYKFIIKNKTKRGFMVSSSGAYKIIGNAVPPVLAYHLAKRIEELWPIYFE